MSRPDWPMSPDWPTLDEDTFEAIFQLIPNRGDGLWSREDIYDAGIPNCRVWTIVEGDDGDTLWCLAGWHSVNVFGFAVSTVSWEDDRTEGVYMEGSPSCDKCGMPENSLALSDWCGEDGTCRECCGHIDPCGISFMGGAECILVAGHDGPHSSGE